jgi:hypothetical protein
MPVWGWFFIATGVLIAFTLVMLGCTTLIARRRTHRLKRRYGAKYDRVIAEAGDRLAGERRLLARDKPN